MRFTSYNTTAGVDEDVIADRAFVRLELLDHLGGGAYGYLREPTFTLEQFAQIPEFREAIEAIVREEVGRILTAKKTPKPKVGVRT